MAFLIILLCLLLGYFITEYQAHLRHIRRLPIRIHVNGTRGKSSVTRLIGAGLRSGSLTVLTKTTGTVARIIWSDDEEIPIERMGKPNIREQLSISRRAAHRNANAVVLECMALQPTLQVTEARRIVRPTVGVITNVRSDHLDVMGPTLEDAAKSFAHTIPSQGILFTTEERYLPLLQEWARSLHTEVISANAAQLTDEEMSGFGYYEHKENVALALQVCQHLGIDRERALRAMHRMSPDPGALKIYRFQEDGKELSFINAFAANDPDSILILWRELSTRSPHRIVILNCRKDRADRSRQLGELLATELNAHCYIITGSSTAIAVKRALSMGLSRERIIDMEGSSPQGVYEKAVQLAQEKTLVFAIGNIVGYGETIVKVFANKGERSGH
jgi:poly-gamma-glutamate synthase PgsB/CapB